MRVAMMGTGTFAEPTFRALIDSDVRVVGLVTQPDRTPKRAGSATRLGRSGMAEMALAASIPMLRPESINAPDALAEFQALQPDLLVVAAYGQILSRGVLAAPTLGAINVHASLLPKYRGAAPVAHAILAGDAVTGVTILRVIPGLDAGEILAQREEVIRPDDTTGELERRLADAGAPLCLEVVRRFAAGPVSGTPQDASLVTRAPKFTKEFGLIDWHRPAVDLDRHVRALQPWPGAYSFLEVPGRPSVRLTVSKATVAPDPAEPGVLHAVTTAGFLVGTGAGSLLVTEVQPAGGRRMTGRDFANGLRLTASNAARFGGGPAS